MLIIIMLTTEVFNVVQTFERIVRHSLFDLGFLQQIGSSLGEDELPWPWFEAVSVILDDRNTVLQKHRTQLTQRSIWC